jgi:hypothetical protein
MSTDTVVVEGAVPDVGLTLSHVALSLAVQFSVPPPVLVMFKDWFAGLAPPAAVKLKLVGLTPIVGEAAALTVNVTGTVTGVLVAPAALIVTVPL